MTQNKAELMVPPTGGRVGAVKAGTGISIAPDGTISALSGGIGWTVTSNERDKTCVTSVRHGLNFLDQITPVQYNWKDRESGEVTDETPRYGFLAQDILAAEGDPAILVDAQDPENLKLRESMMIPVLVQAIKELHEEVKALKQQLG
jgi:hypothetical protein